MALGIFPTKHSNHHQVFYMKYHIFMGDGTTVKIFEKRVDWLNQCIKYFPMIKMTDGQLKTCEPLGEDDLRDIYTLAIKKEWTFKIMESNADPYEDLLLTELLRAFIIDENKNCSLISPNSQIFILKMLFPGIYYHMRIVL
jgi:hypothetical protein